MPSFIPEEVSHCWDLWRYPGYGAINRVCFPLTKTCQHSSSLMWICFFAWRLRKCLCPLSVETSQLLALVSLLTTGDIFLNLAHISDFFFLSIRNTSPWALFHASPPLPLLLLQVSVFLRYSDCYSVIVSAHPIRLPLYVLHAVCASCFGWMDF